MYHCGLTWSSPRSDPLGRLRDPEAVLLGGSGSSVLVAGGIWPPPPLLLIQTEEPPPEATPDSLLWWSRWYDDIFRLAQNSNYFTLWCQKSNCSWSIPALIPHDPFIDFILCLFSSSCVSCNKNKKSNKIDTSTHECLHGGEVSLSHSNSLVINTHM